MALITYTIKRILLKELVTNWKRWKSNELKIREARKWEV